ncbi:MAG TPA: RNA polymerase-binding protein DksA [Thiotrichaceae bacterium]|jgi:DnaK suppressor protein|nr:RNA polymerase-binding protein DksA [Thiotrichaceae bacterium]
MAAKKKTTKKKVTKKKVVTKKAPSKKKKVAKKKIVPKKVTEKKVTKKPTTKKKAAKKAASKKTAVKKQTLQKSSTKKKKTGMTKKVTDIKTKVSTAKTSKKAKPTPYKQKKGEEFMGKKQTEHFRMLLNAWKDELLAGVDRTVHHMQDEAANFPDPNDRATQEEEFSLELRTRDRERKLIRKIDEAILSLDSGDYGYCEVCGIEISIGRLEARPTATQCIDCKTLDEIKERQLG